MELPIILKYDETFMSLKNQNIHEHIRILDIDGVYLVSVILRERLTKVFLQTIEIAFDSLAKAEEYLRDELGIDFPPEEDEQDDWRDYDVD